MGKKDKIKREQINIRIHNTKKIRLTKLEELSDALHPNNIEPGFIKEGFFSKEPTIGEKFWVTNQAERDWFSTSGVLEIIDKHTFKTYNSIYYWEFIK